MALNKQRLEESGVVEYDFSMWFLRHMPFLCLPYKGSVARGYIAKYEINCLCSGGRSPHLFPPQDTQGVLAGECII